MAIFKRDGSALWQYEFELNGKRHRGSTKCLVKADAQAFEVKLRQQLKETALSPGVRFESLETVAGLWLGEGITERRDIKNDESRVRKLFGLTLTAGDVVPSGRFGFGSDLMIHEFRKDHLAALVDARRKEGNSGATINREIALLQSLFKAAEKRGIKLPLVSIPFKAYRSKESAGKQRYLTPEEDQLLLSTILAKADRFKDHGPMRRMVIDQWLLTMFLLDTGARYDEIASLPWSAVSLKDRSVYIHRSKTQNEGTLTLTARLLAALTEREKSSVSVYVFPAWSRGTESLDEARGWSTKGIMRVIDSLGLNDPAVVAQKGKLTAHSFRDTFASRIVQGGGTLYDVQHLLGHASPKMSQKYAHLDNSVGRKAAEILNTAHGAARA